MILLLFFGRYSHFKFRCLLKMPIFLKFSNWRIITAQTTYFKRIQNGQLYFHCGPFSVKTSYNDSTLFFGRYSHFKFRCFLKMPTYLKFQNWRIITAQTTYFKNIQKSQIYFHCGPFSVKTSYNDSTSFFWKIFSFQISLFSKCQSISNFQIDA